MDKDLFAEWLKGLEGTPTVDVSLDVKFCTFVGTPKTVKVCPLRAGKDFFMARLFEGEFSLGEFSIVFRSEAPPEHLGSYDLTVIPNVETERHYATHEAPITSDEDFKNFVEAFHEAVVKWHKTRQASGDQVA